MRHLEWQEKKNPGFGVGADPGVCPALSVAFSYGLQDKVQGFQPGGRFPFPVKANKFRGAAPAFYSGILS